MVHLGEVVLRVRRWKRATESVTRSRVRRRKLATEFDAVAGEVTEAGEGECDGSDATEAGEACGAR